MSALYRDRERDAADVFSKGAPDVLLARCSRELVARIRALYRRAAGRQSRKQSRARADDRCAHSASPSAVSRRHPGVAVGSELNGSVEHASSSGLSGMIDPPRTSGRSR